MKRLIFALVFALSIEARAQTESPWEATIKGGKLKSTTMANGKTNTTPAGGRSLTVKCPDKDCSTVTALINDAELPPITDKQEERSFQLAPAAGQTATFELRVGAAAVLKANLKQQDADPQTTVLPEPTGNHVADFLKTACDVSNTEGWKDYPVTEAKVTSLLLSPTGAALSEPLKNVNERDAVRVLLVADKDLMPYLTVVLKTALRTTGTIAIVGEDVKIPQVSLKSARCSAREFHFRDMAPGTATLEVQAFTTHGTLPLGSTDFIVNRLYAGMFSLGPVMTWSKRHDFGLTNRDSVQVVTDREQSDSRIVYALFYTPFIWGRRDIETDKFGLQRFNFSLGLVLSEKVIDHALVGFSYDQFGFVVTVGAHLARVDALDTQSGVSVGKAFTGDAASLPLAKELELKPFVAVTVDLRAAVAFLKAALGSAAQ